jgi:hypothetical protein
MTTYVRRTHAPFPSFRKPDFKVGFKSALL